MHRCPTCPAAYAPALNLRRRRSALHDLLGCDCRAPGSFSSHHGHGLSCGVRGCGCAVGHGDTDRGCDRGCGYAGDRGGGFGRCPGPCEHSPSRGGFTTRASPLLALRRKLVPCLESILTFPSPSFSWSSLLFSLTLCGALAAFNGVVNGFDAHAGAGAGVQAAH